MTNLGINTTDLEHITAVFNNFPSIEKLVVFGSRAKGTYKKGSDIDLAIFGNNFTYKQLIDLHLKLDDLYLPYRFDLVGINATTSLNLLEYIERVGVTIFRLKSLEI